MRQAPPLRQATIIPSLIPYTTIDDLTLLERLSDGFRDKTEVFRKKIAASFLDWITAEGNGSGNGAFDHLAEPYVAGHSLSEGLESIAEFQDHGLKSTVDILGEAARTKDDADRYLDGYLSILGPIKDRGLDASVSVKPSAICAVEMDVNGKLILGSDNGAKFIDSTPLLPRLEQLVNQAKIKGINVTIDMEDHNYTDITLRAARELWTKGYDNFGIVLQARLDRTREDVSRVLKLATYTVPMEKIRVRAVLGIYDEPNTIGCGKSEGKKRFVSMVDDLFESGVYVEIATHDWNVIEEIKSMIDRKKVRKDRYEFQFLRGVNSSYKLSTKLVKGGEIVRFYQPVELEAGDGKEYMKRRLKANPAFLYYGAKNFIQQLVSPAK